MDNPGDVRLFLNAFEENNYTGKINVVGNGLTALKFLYQKEDYIDSPKPDLLILDFYLPLKDGFEVLSDISKHKYLKHIPVVVISSDSNKRDLLKNCRRLKNTFITKPTNLDEYHKMIELIWKFWSSIKSN